MRQYKSRPFVFENLLESAKALCTRDLFQRHFGSASDGPDWYMQKSSDERKT